MCVCARTRARFTVGDKVASGKGVSKRHPSKIAKAEHVSKSVSRHVLQGRRKGRTEGVKGEKGGKGKKIEEKSSHQRPQFPGDLTFI